VGNDLHGLAEIVAAAFLVDHALVDTACGDIVRTGGAHVGEAFVVPQVEVGFMTVDGHIAFAVFVRVQCPRVDVDVRVEFLDGYSVASGF
jgi:hypothetical protein